MENQRIIKGICLHYLKDSQTVSVGLLEIEEKDFLEQLYSALNCELVEVISLAPEIDLWVDEESLLHSGEKLSTSIYSGSKEMNIVGNIAIFSHDSEGNTASLTPEMFDNILTDIYSDNFKFKSIFIR
ncbi:TPA: DUF3846 domain-containing protein [Enterococcus faecium]|uniref:DUF3846 domain-containing protein n=1 Tax=Enterococcus sp. DIV0206e TaxID=2774690 RepID=UPI0037E11242|nr:DUF3846 domain-containing protein [Enterococcus faecium]